LLTNSFTFLLLKRKPQYLLPFILERYFLCTCSSRLTLFFFSTLKAFCSFWDHSDPHSPVCNVPLLLLFRQSLYL
jgi:hypothetical protein